MDERGKRSGRFRAAFYAIRLLPETSTLKPICPAVFDQQVDNPIR
jgi:hypothetical protein